MVLVARPYSLLGGGFIVLLFWGSPFIFCLFSANSCGGGSKGGEEGGESRGRDSQKSCLPSGEGGGMLGKLYYSITISVCICVWCGLCELLYV